jgi:protein SCO1/2
MPSRLPSAFLILALCVPGACRKPVPEQHYPVKGTVVEVSPKEKLLTVEHEDIPGYMPAMTMPFPVGDEAVLTGAGVGDAVTATLVISESRYYLENVVLTRRAADATPPPPRPKGAVAETRPGEPLPDVVLLDQNGRKVRLADFRSRAFALTFIYTQCPLPDYCPLMSRNFEAVEKALQADPVLFGRTHLFTVSFDTAHDTPEVLKRYGQAFAGTGKFMHWEFLTGSEGEIRRLGEAVGLEYDPDKGMWVHNLRTAVVGADGKLVRTIRGNDWKPDELVADLRAAADRR